MRLLALVFGAIVLGSVANATPTAQAGPIPPTAALIINLPPSAVNTPAKLKVETSEFTFSTTTGQFDPLNQNGITVDVNQLSASNLPYYQIIITGFTQGGAAFLPGMDKLTAFERLVSSVGAKAYSPPPATNILCIAGYCRNPVYDVTLTFDDIATRAAVNNLSDTLETVTHPYAYVGDLNCSASATIKTHLCLKPIIEVQNFSQRSGQVAMLQAVERDLPGEIIVDGNVLATQTIGGFSFPNNPNQRWVAVGGTIAGGVTGDDSQKLANYVLNNAKLQWGNVATPGTIGNRLNALKDEGNNIGTETEGSSYSVVHLNSASADLADPGTSTFSSGPEGKIWKTPAGTFTLDSANVRGVGTIIVNGNLVVNGDLTCSTGARFGLIATGSITFNSPNIACGAYVALGGGITINGTVSGTQLAKGIFVARDTIDLPSVQSGSRYTISYDTAFALDPAALFRQLLNIVFTTTS
ncbi:MAG: hypothetical protein WEC83_01945 [Patescibacteria group bacterium]